MNIGASRVCPGCGNKFPDASEHCPICMLYKGLDDQAETEASSELRTKDCVQRFGHYELLRSEDGMPIELGHGAMGTTYKAFDIDLQYPVTLKVISEEYFSDQSARLRFLREARAAARLRHPNVASVFHLGRTAERYFYAMEFVDGETLERLITRSDRLEVKLALQIATQVVAGLAALHKEKLVHRDVKPSNIMVSVQEADPVTVKIIDLGLAKPAPNASAEAAISTPGAFAGTPEFSSPEQFAGIGVDIRSDLYSVGVTLWQMLTGRPPFRGSPSEVMYQHQHVPLPLEELKDIPQPVVVLLEMLLEKDPARRFQDPAQLLKAIAVTLSAVHAGGEISGWSFQDAFSLGSQLAVPGQPARLGPSKISLARLPVTGSDVFGREEDLTFLDSAWANPQTNVVTICAWAGVGKSALVNYWLRRVAAEHYRGAELVFGWSFYRQGSSGQFSFADEFLDTALLWFGDPDPRLGTGWEKGERLAKLIAYRRTLLILDGLEPLQSPPGPGEGRIREPSLQALLRELAAFNTGLCLVTTRLPIADLANYEHTSAPRIDLEQLSGDAGARLLRALGVKGSEAELQDASKEFSGHCLALTLLGSYLSDAYNGDIRCRKEVAGHLAEDARQGAHAQKIMASYQSWFGEGPELSVLLMLGLFDRPAHEMVFAALLKTPVIRGLTEALINLKPSAWRMILARLRRARLLAEEDPHNPGQLDTHPLVREYFGGQLRIRQPAAWKECHVRLYNYYRTLAPELPNTFREMEPLFLAVSCGCQAGLLRDALHEVYLPRIQRGETSFAAKVLGAREALLSVLAHFFDSGQWGTLAQTTIAQQKLAPEDQLFILMQAGLYIAATRGLTAPEAKTCYDSAEPLCKSLHRPRLLYLALIGRWRYSLITDRLSLTMQLAQRVSSLAQEHNDAALSLGACRALAATLFHLGDFDAARQHAVEGLQIWRAGGAQSYVEELHSPAIVCLCYLALSEWHLGEISASHRTMTEAIVLAKELDDLYGLANALFWAAVLAQMGREVLEAERLASELIELAIRQNFGKRRAPGEILREWARSLRGANRTESIFCIEGGIRAIGFTLVMPYYLALKAEALYLEGRFFEALKAISDAEAMAERFEEHWWCAELHRLRGVFLTAMGADSAAIDASFQAAINTAKQQKSTSLAQRAQVTLAEYHREKIKARSSRAFQLPLS